jgi:hypothetical protein
MAYVVMFFYLGVCGLIFALSVSSPQAMADMRGLFGTTASSGPWCSSR